MGAAMFGHGWLSLVVLHWVVYIFSPDYFHGCIILKTRRLIQPIVQGNSLLIDMGQETYKQTEME